MPASPSHGPAVRIRPLADDGPRVTPLGVRGVTLHRLKVVDDDPRGRLTVGEVGHDLPFTPLRYFVVFDVPGREIRGAHAHRVCEQFLVCLRGSVEVSVDDGRTAEKVQLDSPGLGLYVPPMIWAVQFQYSPDAQLLVLASHPYDQADYIRAYDEFLAEVRDGSC